MSLKLSWFVASWEQVGCVGVCASPPTAWRCLSQKGGGWQKVDVFKEELQTNIVDGTSLAVKEALHMHVHNCRRTTWGSDPDGDMRPVMLSNCVPIGALT